MRKGHQSFNGVQNIGNHLVCGGGAILGDEVPNFGKVILDFRVKIVPGHQCSTCRAALRARKRAFISSPLILYQVWKLPAKMQALLNQRKEIEQKIDIARIEGQVKASSVKRVAEFVDKHPEESVSIIRSWLHETA